jgi:putative transposase
LRHERARFTEEQIIGVLKEHEAGAKTADPARKYGVSEATPYNWKAKYGGIYVSEAKRLKQLEDENAKLKTSVAGQAAQLCQNLTRRRAQGDHSPDRSHWPAVATVSRVSVRIRGPGNGSRLSAHGLLGLRIQTID